MYAYILLARQRQREQLSFYCSTHMCHSVSVVLLSFGGCEPLVVPGFCTRAFARHQLWIAMAIIVPVITTTMQISDIQTRQTVEAQPK